MYIINIDAYKIHFYFAIANPIQSISCSGEMSSCVHGLLPQNAHPTIIEPNNFPEYNSSRVLDSYIIYSVEERHRITDSITSIFSYICEYINMVM